MLRVALRQLLGHKLRLALTALAVALGVAFVAGTFVLSDTMTKAFDGLYQGLSKGTDVTVQAANAFDSIENIGVTRPIDQSLVKQLRTVPGVAGAGGGISGYALVIAKDGTSMQPGGAPTIGASVFDDRALAGGFSFRAGRAPSGPTEMVLDKATAAKAGYALGDRVPVVFQTGRAEFTLVGISGFGESDSLLGATVASFDLHTAQKHLGQPGKVNEIRLRADSGVSADQLRDRVAAQLPSGIEALTTTDLTAQQSKQTAEGLQFFTTFLLVFAMVSLLVGAFLIWNTFSVLVAQRTREIALLRAVGARRGQVMTGVVLEALIVGAVSSAAGLGLGLGLALGLHALLASIGIDLPTTSLVLAPRTVVVTFAVGIVITVVSALVPARAATKVAPIAALREATPAEKAPSRWRTLAGLALTAAGVVVLILAATSVSLSLVGLGVLAAFIGLVVLGPDLARLTARLVRHGRPTGWGMAARTIGRSPRRSATTALALTIGLALVTAVTVTASSTKASVTDLLDRTSKADLIVMSSSQAAQGFSPEVAQALRSVPGVDTVAEMRFTRAKVYGGISSVAALPPDAEKAVDLQVGSGSFTSLDRGTIAVSTDEAKARGLKVGDTVDVVFTETGSVPLKVVATYGNDAFLNASYVVSLSEIDQHVSTKLDSAVLVTAAPGTDPTALRKAATTALTGFPGLSIDDPAGFAANQAKSIDQLLGIVTALLLLAVIVALLGIVNTLALSVLERTRELGLLRAVGAQRTQVTALVRREAVLMAGLGALVGVALGVGAGVALARGLSDMGLQVVDVPWLRLVVYLLAALAAGVLAAWAPGRRAARVDVLRAVTAE
jgi:putative ABC transport system permease protein